MTAYTSKYRDEQGRECIGISFDRAINLKDGYTKQEHQAIDEWNKLVWDSLTEQEKQEILAEFEKEEQNKNVWWYYKPIEWKAFEIRF